MLSPDDIASLLFRFAMHASLLLLLNLACLNFNLDSFQGLEVQVHALIC